MLDRSQTEGDEFLAVGAVRRQWGIAGEVEVQVLTDFPERFAPQKRLFIDGQPMTVEKSRPHKDSIILKLSGMNDIDAAKSIRGKSLEIPLCEAHVLPEGEYYRYQLMGLDVVSTNGEAVGRIVDILPTASNDVYIVRGTDKDVLIPAVDDVIRSIDIDQGRMVIEVIKGLLD